MHENYNSRTDSKLIKKQQSLSQLSALPLLAYRIIPDFDASSTRPTPQRSLTQLSVFVAGYVERNETIDWAIFQEWFVEGVIGLDSRLNLQSFRIPLVDDDVIIDEAGTIRIKSSPISPHSSSPSLRTSFSDDLRVLSSCFHDLVLDLTHSSLLIPSFSERLYDFLTHFYLSLVDTFIQSKDMVLNIHQDDLLTLVQKIIPNDIAPSWSMDDFLDKKWVIFQSLLADVTNPFTVLNETACFGDNGRIPPTWCQSVQKALIEGETHQKMKDVKNHMKFVQILGMYASGASQDASDISFLQAPCFRDTLVRLQTKFQDRANSSSRHPHPVAVMEEESPSIGFSTHSPQLFKQRPAGQSIGTQGVASEGDSYHPSTCTPLSSEESQSDSVDSHQNSTAQMSLQTRLPSSGSSDSISIELSSQETLLWDDRLPRNDYEEAMSVLEILHHIQSAAPQLDNPTPPDIFMFDPPRLEGNEIDLHERFSVAIFDQDVQSLLASLERCRSVCKTVSPTECIDDLPLFVDMLIMFLNSHTDLITQSASRFLFFLFDFIDFDVFINEHWHTLKTAFKDGNEASRFVLLRTIVLLFKNIVRYRSQVASLLDEFDWAGLIASDLEDEGLFVQTVLVLNYIFMYHAGGLSSKCQVASLYRSFEEIQNATARIMPILQREFQEHEYRPDDPLITYCLIQSFHLCLQLPQDLVDFVSAFPHLLDSSTPTPVHPSLVLSHTSMTVNRLKQQAVIAQLIFERTLRSKPSLFFSEGSPRTIHQFRTHALTPLVGLHSLFIRGAHIKPMEFDAHDFLETVPHFSDGPDVWYWDQFRLYSFFPPPLVLQVFSRSLVHSPSIVLSESQLFRIFIPLLRACAPFGECCSFSSLAAYLIRPGPIGGLGQDGPHQALTILHTILSLHWFSLPLSFDSPFLLHPHLHTVWLETEDTINPWDKPPDWEKFLSSLIIETFSSSRDLDNESLMLAIAIGKFYPILRRHSASVFSRCGLTRHLFRFLLSPIPVTVSLALAFLTRVVMESDVRWKMEMLRLGVIDCVVMAILRSSFLEDYEHGVTLIGDLLRTVRHDAQESRMTQINLGDIV